MLYKKYFIIIKKNDILIMEGKLMESKIMPKVFGWMFIGLLLTFVTGYYVSVHPFTAEKLMSGNTYLILAIVEIILVLVLAARITKMQPTTAKIVFIIYSVLSGLTFSSIFLTYKFESIIYVFLATSLLFGLFAFFGMVTKIDLTKIGSYFIIGLIGVIIVSVVNVFLHNSVVDLLISVVIVIIFVGLTAYDVQKIKRLESSGLIPIENLAIYGALELYLDFINIFVELLRIFGKNND